MAKKAAPKVQDLTDPIDFIENFCIHPDGSKVTPHEAQIAIIQTFANANQFIDLKVEAGRQMGKSVGLAWLVTWYVVRYRAREVYIVAPSLDQSRIIYNEVVRQFETGPLRVLLKRKPVDFPFPKLELANGSMVHGRGANSPKYLRGKRVHLLIEDEAPYFKDGIHKYTIEPMFTVTSTIDHTGIIRIGTPFGEGDFDEGVQDAKKKKDGSYLHFTSFDNPYANIERLLEIRDRYGEDSLLWRTEYLAESVGNELAVFDPADIKWAYENYPYVTERGSVQYPIAPLQQHRYAQGVDLANRRDYFVTTLLDVTNPILDVQVRHARQRQLGYAAYKGTVRDFHYSYNRAKTLIDSTTLGESVVEDLRDINAEGYSISSAAAKYDLVHGLVRALNEHRIAIPLIPELVDELKNFQYEITPAKVLRMEAKQGHDDYVISLALANELASRPTYTGFFLGGYGTRQSNAPTVTEAPFPTSPRHVERPTGDPFAELFAHEEEIIHGKQRDIANAEFPDQGNQEHNLGVPDAAGATP